MLRQANPRSLDRTDWASPIEGAVRLAGEEVILVAHSLGCHAVSWWADADRWGVERVKGAMLVAPPDLDAGSCCLGELLYFSGTRMRPLPFPAIVVASENDPYASMEAAAKLAAAWGAALTNVGRAGHINVDSGHGAWPEGERCLADLIEGVGAEAGLPGIFADTGRNSARPRCTLS